MNLQNTNISQALADGLRRFPLVILAGIFGVAAIITCNHTDSKTLDNLGLRIAWAVVFAFPLLVAAAYAGELFPRPRWIFQSAALLAIWALWHFLDLENIGLLVWIAAAATASAVPGLVTHPKSNWWRVNIGSLNALILATFLTLVVLIGLMLAVLSLDKLFPIELSRAYGVAMIGVDAVRDAHTLSRAYGDVMAVCGFLVWPLAFVMLLPAARADLDSKQPGFALWGRFCQWALIPIGFLFTTILSAYAIRILIKRELPDGMVAMPVLVLGCYGLAAQWILEPWRADRSWAKAFSRIFPMAFPLFSILLFMALARRIEEYGFTADRYIALALAVWIVACCLVVLIRRSAPPAFAPALLAAFCLIATLGPLSSQEVCLRSQTHQLEKLLANRSAETDSRINSTLEYLVNNYDQSVVERFTGPLKLEKNSSKRDIENAARIKLGLP
jgi:hypothetical protein